MLSSPWMRMKWRRSLSLSPHFIAAYYGRSESGNFTRRSVVH